MMFHPCVSSPNAMPVDVYHWQISAMPQGLRNTFQPRHVVLLIAFLLFPIKRFTIAQHALERPRTLPPHRLGFWEQAAFY